MVSAFALGASLLALAAAPASGPSGTPADMVATYESLADAILAVKRSEANLVHAILAATHAHAQVELERARQALKAGDAQKARTSLENLAAAVGQLGTEGDNAVAAVRKRLLEGGHHHNAEGEAKGIYDEGFVVVTRAAKQAFLDASRAIAQIARAPKADLLEAEWTKVQTAWAQISKS